MSGSISNFIDDASDEIEDAIRDAATEVGDSADDVANEANNNNAPAAAGAPATATPGAPSATSTSTSTATTTATTSTTASNSPDAQVVRLYEAAFDRAPDSGGLAAWTAALRSGLGPDAVADSLVASPEFQTRYGSVGTDGFLQIVYQNALEREPDPTGRAGWAAALDGGVLDRGAVLLAIANSPESLAGTTTVTNTVTASSNTDPLI